MKTYCAFCRAERKVYHRKRAGFFHFISSFVISVMLMYLIWEGFDPRAGVFFVLFLVLSEIFVQTRWRLSVICQSCGFDPVLYKKNQTMAALKVKTFIEERNAKPENILKKPLKLPVLPPESERLKPKSSLLSRQV